MHSCPDKCTLAHCEACTAVNKLMLLTQATDNPCQSQGTYLASTPIMHVRNMILLCDAFVQITVFDTSTSQLIHLSPAEEWADSTVAEDLDRVHWADTRQAGIHQDGILPMAGEAHQAEALLATAVEALAAVPGLIPEADLAPHCLHHAGDAHLGHPRQVQGEASAIGCCNDTITLTTCSTCLHPMLQTLCCLIGHLSLVGHELFIISNCLLPRLKGLARCIKSTSYCP